MDFSYNSDYPLPTTSSTTAEAEARPPPPFPPAIIDPCARITTRVYNPRGNQGRGQIATVQNVLVRTMHRNRINAGRMSICERMSLVGSMATAAAAAAAAASNDDSTHGGDTPKRKHRPLVDADGDANLNDGDDADEESSFTSNSSNSTTSDEDMENSTAGGTNLGPTTVGDGLDDLTYLDEAGLGTNVESIKNPFNSGTQPHQPSEERAYWMQRTLREAIYGRVKYAVVLKRRAAPPPSAGVSGRSRNGDEGYPNFTGTYSSATVKSNSPQWAEWEVTNEKCAIKEMSWQHIRKERDRLTEDPVQEVSAMQYLKLYHESWREQRQQTFHGLTSPPPLHDLQDMMDTHVMMPVDLLSDDRHLYSVMPYCDGGELFDLLDERSKFSEEECRYWVHQILIGLGNLRKAGICHRDVSLENLLVHRESHCLIIDMGMCLRIPFDEVATDHICDNQGESCEVGGVGVDAMDASFAAMQVDRNSNMNCVGNSIMPPGIPNGQITPSPYSPPGFMPDHRLQKRYLILPQGTCGKWHYMSPEVMQNKHPFDGHAVDMWAVGVILFLMLTGFPPWERPCQTDDRFKFMTAGYLVQMLTEWDLGLSADAMDLLQRMFFLDPKDRLSLDQVRAHPWMTNGRMMLPNRNTGGARHFLVERK